MPTIITQGAASAKALGFARSAGGGGTLQTVTFTTNGTWVAPAGVSLVTTASGYGAAGETVPGSWSGSPVNGGFVVYSYEGTNSPGSSANTPTYAEATSTAAATLASINSSTADRTISFTTINYFYNANTNGTYITYGSSSYRARGSATQSTGPWDNTSSNLVQGIGNGWYFNIERYYDGYTTVGASATALGRTFPGGDGGPAGTTTYTNVAVTPGTSYSISVPAGGSVTLQYIA
jgi:hypothetical protein